MRGAAKGNAQDIFCASPACSEIKQHLPESVNLLTTAFLPMLRLPGLFSRDRKVRERTERVVSNLRYQLGVAIQRMLTNGVSIDIDGFTAVIQQFYGGLAPVEPKDVKKSIKKACNCLYMISIISLFNLCVKHLLTV